MDQTTNNSQESAQEPRANVDGQASRDDQDASTGRATVEQQPGETLLSLLFKIIGIGLLVVVLAIIPTCGTAIMCAIVYHTGNMLRGGKRPFVG